VGWKWEQGDWKAGCDYDMEGKVVKGVFRSGEERKNPDTLERDHAMLIVNRQDDAIAKKRHGADGEDEPKCKRGFDRSSTARLFPAKPSADINDFGGSKRGPRGEPGKWGAGFRKNNGLTRRRRRGATQPAAPPRAPMRGRVAAFFGGTRRWAARSP